MIAKVSKGSVMDQIYLPRQREGFSIGSYVEIRPITQNKVENLVFYNTQQVEPIKIHIIKEIFKIIDPNNSVENIIVTGSFVNEGFHFNDIDIIVISDKDIDQKMIQTRLEETLGGKFQVIVLSKKEFQDALLQEPMMDCMAQKCVSSRSFVVPSTKQMKWKSLDLGLLSSELLIENFPILTTNERYKQVRNLVATYNFIENKHMRSVDDSIDDLFGKGISASLKNGTLELKDFRKKYKRIYKKLQRTIFAGFKYDSEQKQSPQSDDRKSI